MYSLALRPPAGPERGRIKNPPQSPRKTSHKRSCPEEEAQGKKGKDIQSGYPKQNGLCDDEGAYWFRRGCGGRNSGRMRLTS